MNNLYSHDNALLNLPFYQSEHLTQLVALEKWCLQQKNQLQELKQYDETEQCRRLVNILGQAGWLDHLTKTTEDVTSDARSICLFRQTLSYFDDLLDFVFFIQSLSGSVIKRFGNDVQRELYLPAIAHGELAGAFALSELQAGSDVASVSLEAKRDGDDYILNGEKAWIAQGDIADFFIVIARTDKKAGALGLSAFIVDAHIEGISREKIDAIAPRSWAHINFNNTKIPAEALLGNHGQGFIIALEILDRFRMTVAGSAIGFARRAADIALQHVSSRKIYNGHLIDLQLVKAQLAKMEIILSASSLLTMRSAWMLDNQQPYAKDSAIAKYFATENACKVVDSAVQLLGAAGIVAGSQLERLYRQIRPLRIYEGTSDTLLINIASAINTHRVEGIKDLLQ